MKMPSHENTAAALATILRDALECGEAVHVPDLGTFAVEHRSSHLERREGHIRLIPPRDIVTFTPVADLA